MRVKGAGSIGGSAHLGAGLTIGSAAGMSPVTAGPKITRGGIQHEQAG
jgi:hypothetical protein